MSNVGQSAQQRGDTAVSSPAPVAAQAVAPSTIPVSQPANAAHFATMTPLFMTYGQHYPQGIVPTTFHGAAFQTQLYPVRPFLTEHCEQQKQNPGNVTWKLNH
jgi:hypothetical protein